MFISVPMVYMDLQIRIIVIHQVHQLIMLEVERSVHADAS